MIKLLQTGTSSDFSRSYVVPLILLLLTIGSTLSYYQDSDSFADDSDALDASRFSDRRCVSLLIFDMTQREAGARLRLHEKTLDLIAEQEGERQFARI